MSNSRLIITLDIDIPNFEYSATSPQLLTIERRSEMRGLIFRGLKRAVIAFNCLQAQEKRVDRRVFNLDMNFADIRFEAEQNVDGNWFRSDIMFTQTWEEDGYEILN